MNKNKKWLFPSIVIFSVVVNGFIASDKFWSLHYAGDAVGPILELAKQFQILFTSFIISILLLVPLYVSKKLRKNLWAIFISLFLSFLLTHVITYQIANPKEEIPEEKFQAKIKDIAKRAKKVKKLQEKFSFNSPASSIINSDTTTLIKELKSMLTFNNNQVSNREDSTQLELVNHFFHMNFSPEHVDKIAHLKDSLHCQFITYSPDHKQYYSIITYKNYIDVYDNWYKGLVLMCEKKGDKTLCFSSYRELGHHYSREAYMDNRLVFLLEAMEREKLSHLWQLPHFSELMDTDNGELKKYQTLRYFSKEERKHKFKMSKHLILKNE